MFIILSDLCGVDDGQGFFNLKFGENYRANAQEIVISADIS